MNSHIATGVCAVGILGLFVLERDRKLRTSKALWIPTVWVLIAGSRMVSQWLQAGPRVQTSAQYIEGSPLDRIVLTGLLVAGVIVLVSRMRRVITILRMNWPILLFFSYCAASILWSAYPDVAFKRWIKAIGDLVVVLIVLTERDRSAAIKRLLARVGFLLVPLSVLLIEYHPNLGQAYSIQDARTVYTGVTTNKNMLGRMCLVLGLASVWRLVCMLRYGSVRVRQLIAHGAIAAMILWLLFMANSATSTVCFLIGVAIIVYMALPSRRQHTRATLIIVGMVSIALLILVLPDVYASVVGALGRNTTLTGRTKLWHALLGMHTDPWIGTGYASFWLGDRLNHLWSLFWWQPNEAHNGYLGVYLDLGWVGLSLLAVLLAAGYRNIVSALRREPETGILQLGFFITALVYNFTEQAFRMMMPVWIFLLWAIIAVPQHRSRRDLINSEMSDSAEFRDALHPGSTSIHGEIG